ncbi:MAG: adenosylcobinamide amidohydrolase [Pseudomonadales bacterium]|nr:adenosylcobinamide amidohydrolase [Pseudomonadales bacterium]
MIKDRFFRIEKTDTAIVQRFSEPVSALSSASLNGGNQVISNIINFKVDPANIQAPDLDFPKPGTTLQCAADSFNLQGKTLGMMTSASMNSFRSQKMTHGDLEVSAFVTNGLGNARAIGDDHDTSEGSQPPSGTINLWAFCNKSLDQNAMVEAIMMMTEAKVAMMYHLDFKSRISEKTATGTGTDCTAITCPIAGTALPYIGKHTVQGELLGKACLAVLEQSLSWHRNNQYKR